MDVVILDCKEDVCIIDTSEIDGKSNFSIKIPLNCANGKYLCAILFLLILLR